MTDTQYRDSDTQPSHYQNCKTKRGKGHARYVIEDEGLWAACGGVPRNRAERRACARLGKKVM